MEVCRQFSCYTSSVSTETLAYLTAATHGLDQEAQVLGESLKTRLDKVQSGEEGALEQSGEEEGALDRPGRRGLVSVMYRFGCCKQEY